MAKAFIASLNGTAVAELASFSHFSSPLLARCVNTLWFLSLTLALGVALLAILAKQWLGEYKSRMRRHVGSQRQWAWRHLVYRKGLEKWGMDAFISTLPLMLHLSLLLFFIGMVVFLTNLDWVIVGFVLPLTVAAVVFYVSATVAPLWFGDCPTATPIMRQGRHALEFLHNKLRRRLFFVQESIRRRFDPQSWREVPFVPTSWDLPAYDEKGRSARWDAMILCWMVTSLPAAEEIEVALDAVGSLDSFEHRNELHLNPNGVDGGVPIDGDVLCLGSVSIAATARFQRLCEGATGGDAIAISHCIRTLFALSIHSVVGLPLPDSRLPAAYNLLNRWANTPIYDLHILCNAFSGKLEVLELRDTLNQWQNDASPATGETPFISSSVALSFLRGRFYTPEEAMSMALIYSMLSASFISSVLDADRRRTALNVLHDAIAIPIHSLWNIEPVEPRAAMHTPQQLHFCTMSNIGALLQSSPEDTPVELRRILTNNFATLISSSSGVETLTLEYLPYARGLLDLVLGSGPKDHQVRLKLPTLIGDYLCQLESWSEDAGELTRRLIELYSDPKSDVQRAHLAAYLAYNLSRSHLRDIFQSSEMFVRHSLINLLLPGARGEQSAWRTLCHTSPHGFQAECIASLAGVLAPYLTSLRRRGFDVTNQVDELLGGDRLCKIICAANFDPSVVHLAQHARELSLRWWEDTKSKLQSLVNVNDIEPAATSPPFTSDPSMGEAEGTLIAAPSPIVGFIQEIDDLGECQACFHAFKREVAGQNAAGGQADVEIRLMHQAFHRACAGILRMARRGRDFFISDARIHELPVTAPLHMAAHTSRTSLAHGPKKVQHDEPL